MSLVAAHISTLKQNFKEGHSFDDLVTDWIVLINYHVSGSWKDSEYQKYSEYLETAIEDYMALLSEQEKQNLSQQIYEDYSWMLEEDDYSELGYESKEPKDIGYISTDSIKECFFKILDEEIEEYALNFQQQVSSNKRPNQEEMISRLIEELELGYLSNDVNVKEFANRLLLYIKAMHR
jgi:hypothetical protein